METALIQRLVEISVYSAAIFAGLLLFRLAFGRWLSPGLQYGLWFLVILRLLIPVTLESGVHLIQLPREETAAVAAAGTVPVRPAGGEGGASRPEAGGREQDSPVVPRRTAEPTEPHREAKPLTLAQWLLIAWAAGFAAVLAAHLILTGKLNRRIARLGREPGPKLQGLYRQVRADMGIRARIPAVLMPDLTSPALTAQLRPKLLLPDGLAASADREQKAFSMVHELMHYKRRDYLVCLLTVLLRAVYWFNPVVWLLPRFLRVDMETACDAQVVSAMGREQKLRYAALLLALGEGEAGHAAEPAGERADRR